MQPIQNKDKNILIVSIARISFLTLSEKIILLNKLDSASNLALLSIDDISLLIGRHSRTTTWDGSKNFHDATREVLIMEKLGISFVLYNDKDYPRFLHEINDAPFAIFYRGNINSLCDLSVSVVGTRRITVDGKKAAYDFGFDACMSGVNVVSGLALGADCEAHKGAIDAYFEGGKGKTIAVLPGGIDSITPYAHKRLASKILESGGCIISEYVPGTPAASWRFVQRNRIIAGLSRGTVVMQAPPGSGSMLTAQFALDYNRDVMFHVVAFSDDAKRVSEAVKLKLLKDVEAKLKPRSKLENCPEKYLYDGAPVIENYADYCKALVEMPGERDSVQKTEGQIALF